MRKFWCLSVAAILMLALVNLCQAESVSLNGAGASFPYPVYSQWAHKYNELSGVKLNYQSIGSGGGIAQTKAKTVDFGASDAPLKPEELEKALAELGMVDKSLIGEVAIPEQVHIAQY